MNLAVDDPNPRRLIRAIEHGVMAVPRSPVEARGGRLWFDTVCETGASVHFTPPFAP